MIRLKFPKGSSFSFLVQFVKDGAPVDITGATLACYFKKSPGDADAAALGTPTIAAVTPASGLARVTFDASLTSAQPYANPEYFWLARATLLSGFVCAPESLQGPVMLTPFLLIYPPELLTELVPDTLVQTTVSAAANPVEVRADITTAALHRAVVTAGRTTYPWIIVTLESGSLVTWALRAKSGEVDDGVSYRQPTDFHASTNNVIWVRAALA